MTLLLRWVCRNIIVVLCMWSRASIRSKMGIWYLDVKLRGSVIA